jgi:peptidylprolyl isomerase
MKRECAEQAGADVFKNLEFLEAQRLRFCRFRKQSKIYIIKQNDNQKMRQLIIISIITILIFTACASSQEEQMTRTNVLLETTEGNIKIELFDDTMPMTAGNFKKLVEDGFYNDIIFHRVIPNFMIQGGDPTGTGTGGPGYNIQDEFTSSNKNDRGTLSMANAGPNTGGSQFFINTKNNNFLDTKHPVFGKVVEGLDIVDVISNVQRNQQDRPLTDVIIKKASII